MNNTCRSCRSGFAPLLLQLLFCSALLVHPGAATAEHNDDLYAPAVRYSVAEGLSQSVVYDIAQDHVGYLWIATGSGLNRFDGYEFKVFRNEPLAPGSLPGNYIKTLLIDRSHTLWVGTYGNGLASYNAANETFTPLPLDGQTLGVEIYVLRQDALGRIWVATGDGLFLIHPGDNETAPPIAIKAIPAENLDGIVSTIFMDKEGTTWLGTNRGKLYKAWIGNAGAMKTDFTLEYSASDSDNRISSIVSNENKDGLLIGTSKSGILAFDTDERSVSPDQSFAALSTANVAKLLWDSENALWVATEGQGLFRYLPTTGMINHLQYHSNDPTSLSSNRLLSLFEDRNRNLWIGTFAKGINLISLLPPSIVTYRQDTAYPVKLSNELVWSIFEDSDGGLWVGNDSGIDYRARGATGFKKINTLGQPPNAVQFADATAFLETDNKLWIGTWKEGLILYDRETDRATRITTNSGLGRSLSSDTVRILLQDHSGRIWIGTHLGVNVLDTATGSIRIYSHGHGDNRSIPHNRVRSIYQDRNGRIWVGTSAGLSYYDPSIDGFSRATYPRDWSTRLEKRDIRQIHQDRNGLFWLATGSGLDRVDFGNKQLKTYYIKDGLPDDVLYSFLEDDDGAYWISTNNGLSRFDPATETFTNYFAQDGLQDNEFNFGAYFKDSQNRLFFGGISGVSMLNTDELNPEVSDIDVVLNSIEGFDNNYASSRKFLGLNLHPANAPVLEFSNSDKRVVFNFAGLHFQNPYGLNYAYRLINQDNDWIFTPSQHRSAIYTNLAPGEYRFELSATTRSKELVGPVLAVPLTMLPAFWQTLWFRILTFISLLGLILAIIWYRTRKAELAAERLRREVERKTNELQNSYRTRDRDLSAISHDLNTPIAIINQMAGKMRGRLSSSGAMDEELLDHFALLKEGIDEANRKVVQLSKIVKMQRLEYNETNIFNVKPKLEATLAAFEENRDRLVINPIPDCMVNCPPEAPSLILDNLISNALKYGGESHPVELTFTASEGLFRIECKDTGTGIPEEERDLVQDYFYRRAGQDDDKEGEGLGLAIVRSITGPCGGNLVITDNNPQGTIVTASIPIHGRLPDEEEV